jgi:hypothetical protein
LVYETSTSSDWINPRTSGAANAGVPIKVRRAVSPSIARLLMPKSAIFTHQSGPSQTTSIFFVIHRSVSPYYWL